MENIFEKDIVEDKTFGRRLVLWNEYTARFETRALDRVFPMLLKECDNISFGGLGYKVIGNIFDDSELLEE